MKFSVDIIKRIVGELEENRKFESKTYDLITSVNKYLKVKHSPRSLEQPFFYLSTLRNRQLISYEEQERLMRSVVAFFGLSVGSHAALTWIMLSRAKAVKISDPDVISPSNLNRLRFGWEQVGKLKADAVKKELRKINPFCKVYRFVGKEAEIIKKVILDTPKPVVIVDSMDDLESKVLLRLLAKKEKIAVIMGTDVGDNVFLDIERYDEFPKTKLFNGRVKNIEKIDFSKMSHSEKLSLSMQIVGLEYNSEEMLKSLLVIGKAIKTWPQLGSTATVAGGLIATVIKKIILGEKIKSGRYYFLIDDLTVAGFNSKKRLLARKGFASKLT